MSRWTSAVLLAVMLWNSAGVGVSVAQARQASEDDWQDLRIKRFGTMVRVDLPSGGKGEGRLVEVLPDAILLWQVRVIRGPFALPTHAGKDTLVTFARSDITGFGTSRGAEEKYEAIDVPNATVARALVRSLGVDRKVDLRTVGASYTRVRIQAVGDRTFSIERGGWVPFDQVTKLEASGWTVGAKVAMAVGAFGGSFLLSWLIYLFNTDADLSGD